MDFNLNSRRLNAPKNITLSYPKDIKRLVVTWDKILNPDYDKFDINNPIVNIYYNVFRSQSINGIYVRVNKYLINTNRFEDKELSIHPNTRYWYKVSTICEFFDGSFVESKLSQPVTYEVKNENKWFNKMNERNMWILKNDAVLMDLYIRKTEGEHCPKCWNDIRGQSANNNCKVCFGTGFIGGYEPVFQLYVRQKPVNTQVDVSTQGYAYNNAPGAWTISSVQIRNRDLLINPQGRIFAVTSSHINHAAGYYFHQELQMKEIDPTDNRYNIQRIALYPEF